MSPPPKIICVPVAREGPQLERWKSENVFYQDSGGNALHIYLHGRENERIRKTIGMSIPNCVFLWPLRMFLLYLESGVSFLKVTAHQSL